MNEEKLDYLTKIANEKFLKENYQSYITKYKDSNLIMIDFENFKNINDRFGHNIGDDYLKIFANILKETFKDSIVARLHGDEFAVLTKYNEEDIEKKFKLCNQKIALKVKEELIPIKFNFNAGSVKAEHGIKTTKEKADYMMYHAKKNKQTYQPFKKTLYKEKEEKESFLEKIDISLKKENFTYTFRDLFQKNEETAKIKQIYTKTNEGLSIFDKDKYTYLKESSKIIKFDLFNTQKIIETLNNDKEKYIITIDSKTIINQEELIEYLTILKEIKKINYKNFIISIDIQDLEKKNYQKLINEINKLKKLGFETRIEKYDSTIGEIILETSNIDYVKFKLEYWKQALENKRIEKSLESKIKYLEEDNISSVFEGIETQEEFKKIKSISKSNTLYSGNYFSKEKKLLLKR